MNNDIHGLIASVNGSSTSAFMWEWFTTKPFLDRGDVRFVRQQNLLRFYRTLTFISISHDRARIDRVGPHAMAILAHRRAPIAHTCTANGPPTVPCGSNSLRSLLRCAFQPHFDRSRVHLGQVRVPRGGYKGTQPLRSPPSVTHADGGRLTGLVGDGRLSRRLRGHPQRCHHQDARVSCNTCHAFPLDLTAVIVVIACLGKQGSSPVRPMVTTSMTLWTATSRNCSEDHCANDETARS